MAIRPEEIDAFYDDGERRAIEESSPGYPAAERPQLLRSLNRSAAIALLDGAAIAAPIPRVDCLVADIGLVAGGGAPHLVAGYGFSGKTLALQALAVSLASGRPVWGAYRGRQARVLHIDREQGDLLTRRRYQRLAAAMGVDLAAMGDSLAVAVMPQIALTRAHERQWREIMTGRDLVIIDSLRASTAGVDENSSEIRGCLDLLAGASEATGCRGVIIHHSKKPQQNDPGGRFAIRGSSSIYDACDSVYLFASAKGEPVSVEHAKARTQGDSVPDFALVISDVEVDGDPRGGLRVQVHGTELLDERRERREEAAQNAEVRRDTETLRKIIGTRPGLSAGDLRAAARLSGDRFSRALTELGADIEVREVPTGRGAPKRTHYLRGRS
jgi:hypothetical protein